MPPFTLPLAPDRYDARDQREMRRALETELSTANDPLIGTPAQITANQNDYATGPLETLRLSSDASRNVTGIAGGTTGKMLRLINVGSQNIVLQNENALSFAQNRVITGSGADITIAPDDVASLWYDAITARWRVLSHY